MAQEGLDIASIDSQRRALWHTDTDGALPPGPPIARPFTPGSERLAALRLPKAVGSAAGQAANAVIAALEGAPTPTRPARYA